MSIQIVQENIINLETDAIVNAANENLWEGGGVCGAIFKAAGRHQLKAACDKIGYCDVSSAVLTDGFHMKAKYIMHAVGPRYKDGKHGEPKLLYSAYQKSLQLAHNKGCRSIGFPLISSGIFGYPVVDSWRKALQACRDFLTIRPDISIDIIFAVLDDEILKTGNLVFEEILAGESTDRKSFKVCSDASTSHNMDQLQINGRKLDAVFFHLPEEPHGYLSNWYPAPFELDGICYSSAEQYIMHQKCIAFGDMESGRRVLETSDPAIQQAIGRNINGCIMKLWAGMRQAVAIRGLLAKFSQNSDLKARLLQTGDAVLAECAHSDVTWACGIRLTDHRRFDANMWRGENILGFALIEVRNQLKSIAE